MTKLLLLAASTVMLAAAPVSVPVPGTATLTIHVGNVRNAQGRVHVDLCDQARFLSEKCPIDATVPAQSPETVVVIRDVAPGRYAAQLFHDENGNGKFDRGLFGIPKEGIAFSRDAPVHLAPPHWNDAVIALVPGAQSARVAMRYYTGPSGPKPR